MRNKQNIENRIKQRKAKDKKWVQAIAGAFAGVVFLVILYFAYSIFSNDLLSGRIPGNRDEASSLSNQLNILVLGVDKREDDVGRSDTIFLLSIDPKRQQIFQLSIPRDTRVLIPDHGWDKINHAYALGGKNLAVRTVERFLGVKIDHVVEIDFKGFYRIVDAIGGVDIKVDKRMYYEDPWDSDGGLVIDLRPGMQHMDGKTAITYVRYRDEEGDIGRITRQQQFLQAVMDKVSSPGIITRLPAIISEVSSAIDSDLSTLELLNLGRFFKDSREKGLSTNMGMIPGGGYYIDGISYWIPDMETLLSKIDDFDGIAPTPEWQRWATKQKALYYDELPAFDDEGVGVDPKVAEEERLKQKEEEEKKKKKEEGDSDKPVKPTANGGGEKVGTPGVKKTQSSEKPKTQTPSRETNTRSTPTTPRP